MKAREPVTPAPRERAPPAPVAVPVPVPVPVPAPAPAPATPDLVLPPEKPAPLPRGGAMRKLAMDLLYDTAAERPQRPARDEIGGAPEPRLKRHRPKPRPAPPPPPPAPLAPEPEPLVDSGDKLHRVAVVADTYIVPLRPPRLGRVGLVPALRPKSRAECERRCGSEGFCDPSDPIGCGGLHCGRR